MRKLFILGVLVASTAHAATAFWTGQVRYITTITYKQGVECEYNYAGNTFWRTFTGSSCPANVQVQ
jgi:hypothetical protein